MYLYSWIFRKKINRGFAVTLLVSREVSGKNDNGWPCRRFAKDKMRTNHSSWVHVRKFASKTIITVWLCAILDITWKVRKGEKKKCFGHQQLTEIPVLRENQGETHTRCNTQVIHRCMALNWSKGVLWVLDFARLWLLPGSEWGDVRLETVVLLKFISHEYCLWTGQVALQCARKGLALE